MSQHGLSIFASRTTIPQPKELVPLEGLKFKERRKASEMVRHAGITYGGKGLVANPSGMIISKAIRLAQSCLVPVITCEKMKEIRYVSAGRK